MSSQDGSDEELIRAFRVAGPEQRRALAGQLFERHYARVARWCLRFTGERESAADVAQNVFVSAYRHLERFEGASRFSTWLYTIARHECLSRIRRERARPEDSDDEVLVDLPSPDATPEADVTRRSQGDYARQLLAATLDDLEQRVFTLHYGDDLSLDQITRLLGLTNASGAKAYIVSAKRKLARAVRRIEARGGRP